MSIERVRDAYTGKAAAYREAFGSMEACHHEDRQLISTWASRIEGLILDVGCGPGHWTNFLHEAGAEVLGIDPVPAFVDSASKQFPKTRFQQGRAEELSSINASSGRPESFPPGSIAGILAWYSMIHFHPDELAPALKEFARVLAPGGSVLIGFFEGPQLEAFDHAVTTAWFWPIPELARRLADVGLSSVSTTTRTDPGSRPHGALLARKPIP